ncbi:MAG: ABC transporter ATP-binding protein [Rhodospirillales bacterium]|jgi:ATP-binding cassette subfamily B protein
MTIHTPPEPVVDPKGLWRRVLAEVRPFWSHLGALLGFAVAAAPLGLLTPIPLQVAVDAVIGDRPPPAWLVSVWPGVAGLSDAALLVACALAVPAIALMVQGLKAGEAVLRDLTAERIVYAFRAKMFLHVQHLPLTRHDTKGTGAALYAMEHEAGSLHWLIIYTCLPLATAAAALVATIVAMTLLNLKIALVALTVAPVLLVLTTLAQRNLRDHWHRVHEHEVTAFSVVTEALGALRVVKLFGQEAREQRRFAARNEKTVRVRVRAAVAEGMIGLMIGVIVAVGTGTVLYIGVSDVKAGILSVGEFILLAAYLTQLYDPIQTMGHQLTTQQKALSNLERAFALLDEERSPRDDPAAPPRGRARGEIAFRGVGFGYQAGWPTLRDVTVEVPAGARVGIVGRTGAGKSSIIALLARLYDPTEGSVLLDGIDLRRWRLEDLRRQFAVVAQDTVLFSDTVAANIAYARPEATREEVERAARLAGAHGFVTALPQGYETMCGERGQRFSGGERQRIALARAFLTDAPILILDEPTSAVDVATETAILEGIERLMPGRTTILITHRLAALAHCDRVLVMAEGRVVADTTDVASVIRTAETAYVDEGPAPPVSSPAP